MDETIVRVLQDCATSAERARVTAWRQASPENERRYHELAALWSLTEHAAVWPRTEAPAADAVVARAETEMRQAGIHSIQSRNWITRRFSSAPLRAAALAACVVVGFGLGAIIIGRADPGEMILAHGEIRTGPGEMTTVSLGDGSSIRLGPQSVVRLAMEGDTRVAYLDGRAFFGVHRDGSTGFVVRTRFGDAAVLGTRFEVRTEDEEFRVLVVEGRVHVNAGGATADLTQGLMSRSTAGAPPVTTRVDDVYAHLNWMANVLVFQATTVEDAVREIERRFGVRVRVLDADLVDATVTATFTDQSLETVLQVVCEILNARWTRVADEIVLRRN